MRCKSLVLLFVLGVNSTIWAQNEKDNSLSKLFEKASSYPGLKAKAEGVKVAKFNHKITRRKILPEIEFQAQNTYGSYEGSSGGFFPTPGIFNVSGNGVSGNTAVNTIMSATVKWNFLQFGEHRNRVKISQIQEESAQNKYRRKEIDFKHRLTSFFLGWQYARSMLEWTQRESERNENILKLSKSMVRSGLASAADSLAAKTTLKQALAQKNKWEAQTEYFNNKIRELTGIRIATAHPAVQFLSTSKENPFLDSEEKEHPLLISKNQEDRELTIRRKDIKHQLLPNVSLLAGGMLRGVGFSKQGSAWSDSFEVPVNNYLVGLGLTWDVSKFYSKGLKRQKLQHKRNQVNEEKESIERYLEEEGKSSKFHIQKSFEEIQNMNEAYAAAKKSYELFSVRYEKGLIDLTTLLQIQQSLQFIEKSRIKAYYQYWQYWNNYAYVSADFSTLTTVFN